MNDQVEQYIQDNAMSIFYEKVDIMNDLASCRRVMASNLLLLEDTLYAIGDGEYEVAIEFISRVIDSSKKLLQETAYNPSGKMGNG